MDSGIGKMRGPIGETSRCTGVLFCEDQLLPEHLVLQRRHAYEVDDLNHTPFTPSQRLEPTEVADMLDGLLEENKKERRRVMGKPTREERLQHVRDVHRRVLHSLRTNSSAQSNREVALDAGCHPQTVKRITQWMANSSLPLSEYVYNNTHSDATLDTLDRSISDPASAMLSVVDLKRRVPECSKKFIARRMRRVHGLRYLKMRRERKDPKKDKYNKTNIDTKLLRTVLWTSVQAFARNNETLLFLDECEFALYQTPDYSWMKADEERPVYNRRTAEETALHVVALCSQERMVAFQVFEKHPNRIDIYYFLSTFFRRWLSGQRRRPRPTVVLLDNAGWHVANVVMKSSFRKLLLYSVPYGYELNLIELTFSKAKAEWRKRPVVETVEREVEFLAELFRTRIGERGFEGYRRQYLRQLREVLGRHLLV